MLGWAAIICLLTLVSLVGVVVFDLRARDAGRAEIMDEIICQGEITNEGMAGISDLLKASSANPNRPITPEVQAALERLQRNAARVEHARDRCPR